MRASPDRRLLALCFLLSGATSLVLEVAWSKELSTILGGSLYAVATVVASFMFGLCLGSLAAGRWADRFRRPLRAYALLQAGIGLWGLLSIPAFRASRPIFQLFYASAQPDASVFLLARFLALFLVLFLPVILMGMTLPVVVGAVARRKSDYDSDAGLFYGLNTLGAFLGTLLAAFLLLPWAGLRGTCSLAGVSDLAIAGVALLLDRRGRATGAGDGAAREGTRNHAWTPTQWILAGLFAASGLLAIVYEVAWFRLLGLTVGPSTYAFATMLGIYLAGIGLGSAVASRWVARHGRAPVLEMSFLEGSLAVAALGGLFVASGLPGIHARVFRALEPPLGAGALAASQLATATLLLFVPCFVMGALFPVTVRAVRHAGGPVPAEVTVARLYLWNTAGGILGSLLAGFLLIPRLGAWRLLEAAGLATTALAVLLAAIARGRARGRLLVGGGAGLAGVLLLLLAPDWNSALFNQGLYRDAYAGRDPMAGGGGGQLIYEQEGINTAVAVFRSYGRANLHVAGKPDASTDSIDLQTQLLLGHLPVLFCRQPRRVAVIGYGSGTTAGAVLAHPDVASMDVLEIEQAVIDASPYFACVNGDPFSDPRAGLILEDGRTHLTYTDRIYDVITSEPSNPWMAGIANLFTEDFYRLARERLAPGGIFAQWIQNYDISEEMLRVILSSMHEAFPHMAVFQSQPWDFIVLASAEPILLSWPSFATRAGAPEVRRSLQRAGIAEAFELGHGLLAGPQEVDEICSQTAQRNTDDNAWLEHVAPLEMVRSGNASAPGRDPAGALLRRGAPRRLRTLREMLPGVPLDSLARALTWFPFRAEPDPFSPAALQDPWSRARSVQLPALRAELEDLGLAELAQRAQMWEAEAAAYQHTRAAATQMLLDSRRDDGFPARDIVEEARRMAPDLPFALAALGTFAAADGDLDRAEEAYRRALAVPSSGAYYDALLGLAQVSWARGDLDQAAELAAEARAWNPYLAGAYLLLSELQRVRGDRAGARRTLEEGLRMNPHHHELEQRLAAEASPG